MANRSDNIKRYNNNGIFPLSGTQKPYKTLDNDFMLTKMLQKESICTNHLFTELCKNGALRKSINLKA